MFGLDAEKILTLARVYGESIIKNLTPTVTSLMGTFIIIDLVLSFMFDESEDLNIFIKLLKKIFYYGFFIWIIQEYSYIVFKTLMGGAIQLANVAAGKGAATEISIELISKFGADMKDLLSALVLGASALVLDFAGVESGTTVLMMGILGYIIFFIMLYVQILVTFVKFYLVAGFAFILMPFGCFTKTKDIALKGLNGLFSQAIEIFVLIVILNIASDFMDNSFSSIMNEKIGTWAKIKEGAVFTRTAILMFLFLLINRAGSIASSLLSGSIASLGIGSEAGARGLNNAISTPGNLAKGMADRASASNPDRLGEGGAKAFRKGSFAANAYRKASDFMKNKS